MIIHNGKAVKLSEIEYSLSLYFAKRLEIELLYHTELKTLHYNPQTVTQYWANRHKRLMGFARVVMKGFKAYEDSPLLDIDSALIMSSVGKALDVHLLAVERERKQQKKWDSIYGK